MKTLMEIKETTEIAEIKEIRGYGAKIVADKDRIRILLGGPNGVWIPFDDVGFELSPQGYGAAMGHLATSYLGLARITPRTIIRELLEDEPTKDGETK